MVTKNRTNNWGYVNNQNYEVESELPLLSVIGDSYVEALMVPHDKTLHGTLEKNLAGKARVYSFATSGSPLSQYLNFAELASKRFKSQFMAFVIISNDFDESVLKYKNAPGFHYFTDIEKEPVLTRVDFRPSLPLIIARRSRIARYLFTNVQVQNIGELFRKSDEQFLSNTLFSVSPEVMKDSKRAVDIFFKLLPSCSRLSPEKILFVVDAVRESIYSEEVNSSESYFGIMRNYFISKSRQLGYEVIDLDQVFRTDYKNASKKFEFEQDWHWNAYAHNLVSQKMLKSGVLRSVSYGQ